ncbi:nuclear transport factor 2 family protein [Myxococcus xanthus]|nr:nuclear transport factor 2 family protein [Myxococcus xanthus]QPM80170.1 nuclear transport factor 2 family protein [Myxococcus xanthus]QVW69234.1 nuclear transport factor 2 family protein [Myxococcus xanthus DZ2]UEO04639.1 nuclear transport factor 2 family protein [Myxococcus xanthus DZ2]
MAHAAPQLRALEIHSARAHARRTHDTSCINHACIHPAGRLCVRPCFHPESVTHEHDFRGADGAEMNRDAFIVGIAEIPGDITSVEAEKMKSHVFGDTGVLAGVQRSRVRMTDGSEVTDAVYFTDVWQRRDGTWLMVFAHSSPAAPTEAQQAPEGAPQQQ